jgi:hypothetical protein
MNENFLVELGKRLVTKNPQFFDKIQVISTITGIISGIMMYLQDSTLPIPSWLLAFGNVNVLISSIVAAILAQLPNESR